MTWDNRMPPRKRKAPTRYEGESPVKRVKSAGSTPSKRTSTPRAAKVNRNDPEWLVTSEKSPLANEDLHVSATVTNCQLIRAH
jgi:hypothetical protein